MIQEQVSSPTTEAMFAKTSLARASQNAAAVQSYQVRSARRLEGPWPVAITQASQLLAKWAKYSNLVSGSLMIFSKHDIVKLNNLNLDRC